MVKEQKKIFGKYFKLRNINKILIKYGELRRNLIIINNYNKY